MPIVYIFFQCLRKYNTFAVNFVEASGFMIKSTLLITSSKERVYYSFPTPTYGVYTLNIHNMKLRYTPCV